MPFNLLHHQVWCLVIKLPAVSARIDFCFEALSSSVSVTDLMTVCVHENSSFLEKANDTEQGAPRQEIAITGLFDKQNIILCCDVM